MWNSSEYSYRYFAEKSTKAAKGYKNGGLYPMGKVLGGSGSINAMIYTLGVQDDYKSSSGSGFDFEYKKPEFYEGFDKTFKYDENLMNGLLAGANEAGYKTIDDINSNEQIGFVLVKGSIKDGSRYSSAKAFLSRVKDRQNLKVINNAVVSSIITNGNKIEGVTFELNGRMLTARTRKEVILSAGTFKSAKLLMLSGIGKADDLRAHNIPQIIDLPVGYNFHDHPMLAMNYQFAKSTAADENPFDNFQYLFTYLTKKSGPFAGIGCTNLLGFHSTKGLKIPDIEYAHMCLPKNQIKYHELLQAFSYNDEMMSQWINYNKQAASFAANPVLLKPKSRGFVKLRSRNFKDPPIINPNFLDVEEDVTTLLAGIRAYQKIVNTKVYKSLEMTFSRPKLPDCDLITFDSDDYWRCYMKYFTTHFYHPVGTCKMGNENDPTTVVLPNMKVKGMQNLRVVDASIIPIIPRAHTFAPTVMIAEKAAEIIKNEWKLKF